MREKRQTYGYLPIACLLVLVFSGCDPGFCYLPVDAQGKPVASWSREMEGVVFRTDQLVDLEGVSSIGHELEITNHSQQDVVLCDVELQTDRERLKAEPPGKEALQWRTVAPGTSKRIFSLWELPEQRGAASTFLGEKVVIRWQVRNGNEVRSVEAEMVRKH